MGQGPDEIRRDIEETRYRMGRTLDQLEDRLSPRRIARRGTSQLRARWHDTSQALKENVMGTTEEQSPGQRAGGNMRDGTRQAADRVREARSEVRRRTEGNPLAAGVIAFGAGMLAAALLPRTRTEEQITSDVVERLEPARDEATAAGRQLVEGVRDSAQRGLEHTREAATEAAGEVRDEAGEAAEAVRAEAQTGAQRVRSDARDTAGAVGERAEDATEQVSEHAGTEMHAGGNGQGRRDAGDATGQGEATPYEERTVEELQRLASERDIPGRSTMNKAELIEALRR